MLITLTTYGSHLKKGNPNISVDQIAENCGGLYRYIELDGARDGAAVYPSATSNCQLCIIGAFYAIVRRVNRATSNNKERTNLYRKIFSKIRDDAGKRLALVDIQESVLSQCREELEPFIRSSMSYTSTNESKMNILILNIDC